MIEKRYNSRTFKEDGQVYYYIHRHLNHFEKDDAIAFFEEQKKQNYAEMRERYKSRYLENIISINDKSLKTLEAAMNEEELTDLDEDILNSLNSSVSEAISKYKTSMSDMLSISYKSLDSIINEKSVAALNNIFAQVTKAAQMLNTDLGDLVKLIGLRGKYKNYNDLPKLSRLLQIEIGKLETKTIINVSRKRLISLEKSLLNFVTELGKDEPSKQSLREVYN